MTDEVKALLTRWLDFYAGVQDLAPDGLVEETEAALERVEQARPVEWRDGYGPGGAEWRARVHGLRLAATRRHDGRWLAYCEATDLRVYDTLDEAQAAAERAAGLHAGSEQAEQAARGGR